MLALNLAKIRTPEEHFEQVYRPEVLGGENEVYRIVAPVSLALRDSSVLDDLPLLDSTGIVYVELRVLRGTSVVGFTRTFGII